VYDLMGTLDVFVLSSLHEGVPMVVLEAMALGIPIVASHVGGIPEVLENCKEAVLIPAKDPGALAKALGLIAGSPELRIQLVRAARGRVETQFSIQSSAVKMHEMYGSLCSTKGC
jgi:L-malate glycosyltransferase